MADKGRVLAVGLCAVLCAGACAFAQNPLINPGFEDDLGGWTPYAYDIPPSGTPAMPVVGCIGLPPCPFDMIRPPYTPEGANVCGMQASGETRNGGVYQVFGWSGGPATLSVTARAYSEKFSVEGGGPAPGQCLVRMGLVTGQAVDRSEVRDWTEFDWGEAWGARSIDIPGPGIYTLFIESVQPFASAVMSTLWDNVTWTELPSITVSAGDPRIMKPGDFQFPESTVRIEWTTNAPSSSRVDYGLDQAYGQVVHDPTPVTEHSVLLTNLAHTTTYHFRATSAASGYAPWVSDDGVFETPIQFNDIVVNPGHAGSDMVVRWKTDVPATSRVEFGQSAAYGDFTPEDPELVSTHEVTVTGLVEDKTYHFRVWGRNPPKYSNACSADYTFRTLPTPSPGLRNGSFEEGSGGSTHSLYPWVQYTTGDETVGYHPIDGLVGAFPRNGGQTWYGAQAYDGGYFVGAASNNDYKNGGVFQRVFWPAGQPCVLSARYLTRNVGGIPGDTRVRVGIDPDGGVDPDGPDVKWWTAVSPTNDTRWHLAGVAARAGATGLVTVFLDIKEQWAIEWHIAAVDRARLTTPAQMTIGQLKQSQGDVGVLLANKIVTHIDSNPVTSYDGTYYKAYVEEDDRSAGIAVYLRGETPVVGNRLTVIGPVVQHCMEAVVVACEWRMVPTTDPLPAPFGMSTRCVGGSTPLQPALFAKGGACNVGLRARLFGRVTWVDWTNPFWDATAIMDDGAGIIDQQPAGGNVKPPPGRGIRVKLAANGSYGVRIGDYVEVTGVVTVEFMDPKWPPYSGDEYYAYTVATHQPADWRTIPPQSP